MKTLQASEGKFLTNPDHSAMGVMIMLPDTADETQFTEITEATFQKYQKQNAEKAQKEVEEYRKSLFAQSEPGTKEEEQTEQEQEDEDKVSTEEKPEE